MSVTNLKALKPEVDHETVKLLEAALEEARAGELRDILVVGRGKAGSITSFIAECDWPIVVGYIERLKYRLMREQDEVSTLENITD